MYWKYPDMCTLRYQIEVQDQINVQTLIKQCKKRWYNREIWEFFIKVNKCDCTSLRYTKVGRWLKKPRILIEMVELLFTIPYRGRWVDLDHPDVKKNPDLVCSIYVISVRHQQCFESMYIILQQQFIHNCSQKWKKVTLKLSKGVKGFLKYYVIFGLVCHNTYYSLQG